MATIIKNIKDGKVISYKFRSCLGRDDMGKQISRYTTWHIPAGLTPSKAERAAKTAAAEWEKQVKWDYEQDLKDPARIKAREIDRTRTDLRTLSKTYSSLVCVMENISTLLLNFIAT